MVDNEEAVCLFSVEKPKGAELNDASSGGFGIKITEEGFEDIVIYDVTDDEAYANDIVRFLNENKVSREHISQVIEEILCMWPCVE